MKTEFARYVDEQECDRQFFTLGFLYFMFQPGHRTGGDWGA